MHKGASIALKCLHYYRLSRNNDSSFDTPRPPICGSSGMTDLPDPFWPEARDCRQRPEQAKPQASQRALVQLGCILEPT